MARYAFFTTGAEWAPNEYMVFGRIIGRAQHTDFFTDPPRWTDSYTTWDAADPLGPQVIPGPGAKPGATDPTNPRRVIVERREAQKGKNLENQAATGLIMALAAYYS